MMSPTPFGLDALKPLSPFVRASIAWHALALTAALAWPGALPWAVAALVLNHLVLTAATLTPRTALLGGNITRLPASAADAGEVALTIDDGPDPEVTPKVLDLLDAAGQRATFFCIAERVALYPELARQIVARGHDVQNHTARHSHTFSLLGPAGYAREIGRAQDILKQVTGVRPTCFRAPAGFRNLFLAPVLQRLDLQLVSWTRRGFDTRDADPARVQQRLLRGLRAGDILLLHDGNAARTARGGAVLLDVLPPLLEQLRRQGLHSVTLTRGLSRRAAHAKSTGRESDNTP